VTASPTSTRIVCQGDDKLARVLLRRALIVILSPDWGAVAKVHQAKPDDKPLSEAAINVVTQEVALEDSRQASKLG